MKINAIRDQIQKISNEMSQISQKIDDAEGTDLNKLETQLNSLIDQKTQLENEYTKKKEMLSNCNDNSQTENLIDAPQPDEKGLGISNTKIGSLPMSNEDAEIKKQQTYTNIWVKNMLGHALNENERNIYNEINKLSNNFTHSTQEIPSLVPETIAKGIWKRAEENYPLYSDIKKFAIEGTISFRKHLSIEAGDAAFYDEPTVVETEENTFGYFTLSGCELAKAVKVTWKMKTMAIDDFVPFLIKEIGDRIGVALGTAIAHGKGQPSSSESFKPEPLGIITALEAETGTPQIINYTTLTYKDFTTAMSRIHSSYSNKVTIYANNNTIWNQIANILDANKRPIFVADAINNNGVGRILGKVVKTDAGLKDGEILFADAYDGYIFNVNKPMTMHTEDHMKERETDYMGYTIVDGGVFDNKAFALLKSSTGVI